MERNVQTARRIMYGNVMKYAADATLNRDSLHGKVYEGFWDSAGMRTEARGTEIYSRCDDVFRHLAPVWIGEVKKN